MAPRCRWFPRGEAGQYRVICRLPEPGAWVAGTAQRLQGAHLQRVVALPDLSVAGRPAVSRLCGLHGLRHTGLGVLSQKQEMDLRTGVEVPLPCCPG